MNTLAEYKNTKVLVVGTTPDYIEWILSTRPGMALFLTDYSARMKATEETEPSGDEEILTCLEDEEQAISDLLHHIRKKNIRLAGIACFDCESMELAASIARHFSLPYPGKHCILLCRDKYASKKIWLKNGIRCPQARLVQNAVEVYAFMHEIGQPCVLKPLTGSGSELVFRCSSKKDCDKWAQIIRRELACRTSNRLYAKAADCFLAEEYISGEEYSCDFIVSDKNLQIIRLTQKIHAADKPFGTIVGYTLSEYPNNKFSASQLEDTLRKAANVLGIEHAICMVDFLITGNEIVLLEITPRPGGDCIPHLLRRSGRVDVLSLTLDFAAGLPLTIPSHNNNNWYTGVRIHAKKPGTILKFNTGQLENDPRVRELQLIRHEGHRVTMPPADYDSWHLGHVIFQPTEGLSQEEQCNEIRRKLIIETAS